MGRSMIFLFILTHTDSGIREGEVIRITPHNDSGTETVLVVGKRQTGPNSIHNSALHTNECLPRDQRVSHVTDA